MKKARVGGFRKKRSVQINFVVQAEFVEVPPDAATEPIEVQYVQTEHVEIESIEV
jgi:hypothetical protein